MSAISFDVRLQEAEARDRLYSLIDRIDNRPGFHADVGQGLVNSTRERFRAQRDPAGAAWTPLKPATIRVRMRRRRAKISILRETGALAGSISFDASDDGARVGSTSEYAAIYQLGGKSDVPTRQQTLHFRKATV